MERQLVRFTWLDAIIIGGGVIVTAVIVAVFAKPKPADKVTPRPPPPPPDEVPGIPAVVEFPIYPTSLSQLYGFYYTMATPLAPQKLQYKALTRFVGPPYPEGHVSKAAKIRVVDAAGRGVPNVAVLIWSVPTTDDQSGQLIINNSQRSEAEPLRLVTGADGEAILNMNYLLRSIVFLEDKHRFGCCNPFGWMHDINVGGHCGPVPAVWICRKSKDANTDPKAYTVNAKIEGTVKASLFVVQCLAKGRALW